LTRFPASRRPVLGLLLSPVLAAAMLIGVAPAVASAMAADAQRVDEQSATTSGRGTLVQLPEVLPQTCYPWTDPGYPDPGGGDDCLPPPPPPPLSCGFGLQKTLQRIQLPDTGVMLSRVGWSATIDCSPPYEARIIMSTRLVERTPGQPDGRKLVETIQTNELKPPGQPAFVVSAGFIDLYDEEYYPAAQQVEAVLDYSIEIVRGVGTWGDCPQLPGLRNLACGGTGTRTATGSIGTYPFDTGVQAPTCRNLQWDWTAPVAAVGVHTMAAPLARFEWCVTPKGNVKEARFLSFSSNSAYPNLVVEPNPPTITMVKSNDGTYSVSFAVNWKFNAQTTVGIGVLGKDLLGLNFGINESCQQSVAFTLSGRVHPLDTLTGTNPCKNWRPIMGQ
jgi:hypothetical protein